LKTLLPADVRIRIHGIHGGNNYRMEP
jgi:hypothetical protein